MDDSNVLNSRRQHLSNGRPDCVREGFGSLKRLLGGDDEASTNHTARNGGGDDVGPRSWRPCIWVRRLSPWITPRGSLDQRTERPTVANHLTLLVPQHRLARTCASSRTATPA